MQVPDMQAVLDDPTASFWLKHAIYENLQRDPLDAASDTALLAQVMNQRADAELARSIALTAERVDGDLEWHGETEPPPYNWG